LRRCIHFFRKLPRDNTLCGNGVHFLKDALFPQKVVKMAALMFVFMRVHGHVSR
jgi:hypothetical protein